MDVAKELAQEAFLKLWDTVDRLPGHVSIPEALYQFTRRAALDMLRRDRRRTMRLAERGPVELVADAVARDDDTEALADRTWGAIEALSERLREPLLLFWFGGWEYDAIATILDVTPWAAMKRVSRAYDKIRELLAPT